MALRYQKIPVTEPLVQGEILENLVGSAADGFPMIVPHPLVVVMNNVCDLRWDSEAREAERDIGTVAGMIDAGAEEGVATTDREGEAEEHPSLVPQVFICDLIYPNNLKQRMGYNAKEYKRNLERIQKSNDARFHYLAPADIEGGGSLAELVMDFKKTFAVPTLSIYEGIGTGQITRRAIVPAIYLHDLIQRYHSYLSRVGLPD